MEKKEYPKNWWIKITTRNIEILKKWSKNNVISSNNIIGIAHWLDSNRYAIEWNEYGHTKGSSFDFGDEISFDLFLEMYPEYKENTKEQALRFNSEKPKWSQVDFKSLEPMVKVLEYGESKYGKFNWKKGLPASEVIESLLRHTFALLDGEEFDKESGLEHIGHIQSNAMFLAYVMREKREQFNDIIK